MTVTRHVGGLLYKANISSHVVATCDLLGLGSKHFSVGLVTGFLFVVTNNYYK